MDLTYTEDQQMLRDTVRRLLAERHDFPTRQAAVTSGDGRAPGLWATFAEQGWLALPFSEENGGFGSDEVDLSILMEEMGRALVVEPYFGAVVLAGGLVERLGIPAQRAALLEPLIEGRHLLAFADVAEAGAEVRATKSGGGFTLSGRKQLVLGGAAADVFLVSASMPGGCMGVFVVPRGTEGLKTCAYMLADGSRAARLELDGLSVAQSDLLGAKEDAMKTIDAVRDRAVACLCSDAVGAMEAALDATVAYTSERQQFGRSLSEFQALRHRMAEMAVKCQEARASALLATVSINAEPSARIRGVSGAKAKIGRNARSVAQEAIQLHGAMGFTEEMATGAWFKRLFVFEQLMGTTAQHLARYGAEITRPEVLSQSLLQAPSEG